MKVSKLIEELLTLDPDLDVILAKDPEGNGYLFLDEVAESLYYRDDYRPEVVHPDDESEYDSDFLQRGVVLWP